MNVKFVKNIRITGDLVCLTGLHIGSVKDSLGIGGSDSPVVLDKIRNVPIIPGSSLKGKMRSLLELTTDKWLSDGGKVHSCQDEDCDLCVVFGRGATENIAAGPTRLIVRDAFPTDATCQMWENAEDVVRGTELKGENFLNRLTSAATPRFIDRVPAGSVFSFEMIFSVYCPEDLKRLAVVFRAMQLLEDSYLGGSGTRGYGKVAFQSVSLSERSGEDYLNGRGWTAVHEGMSVDELLHSCAAQF